MLLGRRSIGVDIDPLAILQSKVKTTLVNDKLVVKFARQVAAEASLSMMEKGQVSDEESLSKFMDGFDSESRRFFSYWFHPGTAAELSLLIAAINRLEQVSLKDVLKASLSSIIISKSAGVSLARDVTHTRPHKVRGKRVLPVIPAFERAAIRMAEALKEINEKVKEPYFLPSILEGDSKALPVMSNSVKLVITSPPYATALDYMRAHKFSLTWLGYNLKNLSELRRKYIGAESGGTTLRTGLKAVDDSIAQIGSHDLNKGKAIARYFAEMQLVMREIYRVIQPGGYAVIVVGPSRAKGIMVMTHEALVETALGQGFEHVGTRERKIEQSWRQLPVSNNSTREGIEARIHEEYILLFCKL
jgi:hypothetical protein